MRYKKIRDDKLMVITIYNANPNNLFIFNDLLIGISTFQRCNIF